MKEKKLKQTNASAHLFQTRSVKAVQEESEWLWRKGFMKEMSFKSGVKGRGTYRWWEQRWWPWWGDMRRMRWTRRRVNRMRLTEWRRQLIPQKGDAYVKERLVICNEEDTDCQLILAHCGQKQIIIIIINTYKRQLKQTNASAHLMGVMMCC